MFEITVDLPNEAQFKAAMADAANGWDFFRQNELLLESVGIMLATDMKSRVPVAFGTLRNAIGYRVENRENLVVGVIGSGTGPSSRLPAADYARFVDEGRAPGRMPPPDVLRPWMTQRGFTGSEYVLRRSIAEKGTPAHPFLVTTLVDNEAKIATMAEFAYKTALDKIAARASGGGILSRIGGFLRSLFG